ncbi:hypothetical protein [Methylobacter psychrophilus]|jgi:hypothetical protein|uniref:hypothetical protein n=1 Tax=Methylobacter psychrophilus TaxID=96941 RepID=UPI0021D4B6CE|nr:hypothetical protein [Methylobacter psychrophilus]
MKKLISLYILLSVISGSAIAQQQSIGKVDRGFILLDVLLYRPVGVVATVIGSAVFVGVSPLIGLASIPEPHDAFAKMTEILVLAPAAYTFVRPIGDQDFPYHASPDKQHLMVAPNNAETHKDDVLPKPAQAPAALPDVKSPQSYPDAGKGL